MKKMMIGLLALSLVAQTQASLVRGVPTIRKALQTARTTKEFTAILEGVNVSKNRLVNPNTKLYKTLEELESKAQTGFKKAKALESDQTALTANTKKFYQNLNQNLKMSLLYTLNFRLILPIKVNYLELKKRLTK